MSGRILNPVSGSTIAETAARIFPEIETTAPTRLLALNFSKVTSAYCSYKDNSLVTIPTFGSVMLPGLVSVFTKFKRLVPSFACPFSRQYMANNMLFGVSESQVVDELGR